MIIYIYVDNINTDFENTNREPPNSNNNSLSECLEAPLLDFSQTSNDSFFRSRARPAPVPMQTAAESLGHKLAQHKSVSMYRWA